MRRNSLYNLLTVCLLAGITASCVKEIDYGTDPYGESTQILGVKFADAAPYPSQGRPGEEITYKIYGLETINKNDIEFFVNNNPSVVTASTDSTLTVLLPDHVSTGSARLVVNGQTFAGPLTPIIGKVAIDPVFSAGTGTIGFINTIAHLSNGQFFLGGYFSDYNGNSALADINGIARISSTGEYVPMPGLGEGPKDGSVSSILELPDNKIFIAGNFSRYDVDENVRSMTILKMSGELETDSVEILNLTDDPANSKLEVPVFNGGVSGGGVVKAFYHDNKITLVGAFDRYTSNYYPRSTYNQILRDFFQAKNIVRLNMDGSLDSTFLVNHDVFPKRGSFGVNGSIQDAVMNEEGTLTVVGSFTQYNNAVTVNRILRLKSDGSRDDGFNVGSGADNTVFKIVPTSDNKYYLVGSFLKFNGQAVNNIVLINADGTVDPSFKTKSFTGGSPSYLTVLDNGLLLVTGSFNRYDNIIREGLLILNPDGSLAADYNNTGKFVGAVQDAYLGVNSLGQRTITLVGSISSFNGKSDLGNIVRLTIQD